MVEARTVSESCHDMSLRPWRSSASHRSGEERRGTYVERVVAGVERSAREPHCTPSLVPVVPVCDRGFLDPVDQARGVQLNAGKLVSGAPPLHARASELTQKACASLLPTEVMPAGACLTID